MKKTFAIFIVLIAVLLAGCGKNDTPANYEKGTVTENIFESKYLNLKFTAPEGYTMATQAQLEALVEYSADNFTNIDSSKIDMSYEMMVLAPGGSPNVSVTVEKLKHKKMSEEQYIEALKTQLKNSVSAGFDFEFGEKIETAQIGGKSFTKLSVKTSMYGQKMLQDYYLLKIDDRMVLITATYTEATKADMEKILNGFEKLN